MKMGSIAAVRVACLAGLAVTTNIALAAPATAQTEATVDYDLPAQDLDERLRAIARLSGSEVIFASEAVEGRKAPPLKGRFTVGEAIRSALAGSRLIAEYRSGAVLIRERPTAAGGRSAPAPEADVITITGTRIRGAGSASPVIVTNRQALENAGITDLSGFSRILPQNFTGGQNPGVAGGGQQGGQSNINNSTTLNLRGLGPDATLTLVNGHRLAYDALNQGVDIGSIPLIAIDRIEVIADGASALYGSDAVGGVANIILRRDYQGALVSARLGASTEGGNEQQQYSAIAGGRWGSGGFMAAVEHVRASPILAGDRDYTASLDPSASLISRNRQISIVLAGHQRLIGQLEFEVDGQFAHRRSRKSTPFSANADVFTSGLLNRPEVDSYSVTPTFRLGLPGGWEARASASHGLSRTEITSSRFSNRVEFPAILIYENRFSGLEANAEGPLLHAPGGSARLAIGGGLRSVVLDVNVSQLTGGGRVTTRDLTDKRDVWFAYGELSVPLVGPDNVLPLVERLRLTAAVRYERYDGVDEVATPKLGIIYEPHPDVTIRAAWGRSFKVPTLNQINEIRAGALVPGSIFTPQPTPPLPPGAAVLFLAGGSDELRAERAETWTAGIELTPRLVEGLKLQANYFDVDYRDRVSSPVSGTLAALANPAFRDFVIFNPTAPQVQDIIATLPLGLSNQTGAPFDPARVAAIIDASLRNVAIERARGVDLAADYLIDTGGGQLQISAAASYLDSERQLSARQPVLQRAGTIFNPPHWRARLGGTWQSRSISLTAFLNHVGGTTDDRFASPEKIGAFTTLDISAGFRSAAMRGPLRGVELRLSALNLLNEEPETIRDLDPAAPPYDSTNQSPVGRFISLSISKRW